MPSNTKGNIIYSRKTIEAKTIYTINNRTRTNNDPKSKWQPCGAEMLINMCTRSNITIRGHNHQPSNFIVTQLHELPYHAFGCRVVQKYLEQHRG